MRLFVLFRAYASEEELKQLVALITRSFSEQKNAGQDAITNRLMKRADFWEYSKLQSEHVHSVRKLYSAHLTTNHARRSTSSRSTPARFPTFSHFTFSSTTSTLFLLHFKGNVIPQIDHLVNIAFDFAHLRPFRFIRSSRIPGARLQVTTR